MYCGSGSGSLFGASNLNCLEKLFQGFYFIVLFVILVLRYHSFTEVSLLTNFKGGSGSANNYLDPLAENGLDLIRLTDQIRILDLVIICR